MSIYIILKDNILSITPNNCFNLTRLLSQNLLLASLSKFCANVRLAG
jgi:hypothetical protein